MRASKDVYWCMLCVLVWQVTLASYAYSQVDAVDAVLLSEVVDREKETGTQEEEEPEGVEGSHGNKKPLQVVHVSSLMLASNSLAVAVRSQSGFLKLPRIFSGFSRWITGSSGKLVLGMSGAAMLGTYTFHKLSRSPVYFSRSHNPLPVPSQESSTYVQSSLNQDPHEQPPPSQMFPLAKMHDEEGMLEGSNEDFATSVGGDYKELQNISEDSLKDRLMHLRKQDYNWLSFKSIKKISKSDVLGFIDTYMKESYADKEFFSSIILRGPGKDYLAIYANKWNRPIEDVVAKEIYWREHFLEYLKKASILTSDKPERSFAALQRHFRGLSDSEMLLRLNESQVFADIDLQAYEHFNIRSLKFFIANDLKSNAYKHLFYSIFLGLDDLKMMYIAKLYGILYNTLKHNKNETKKKLLGLFENGVAHYSRYKNFPLVNKYLSLQELEKSFYALADTSFKELADRVQKYVSINRKGIHSFEYLNKQNLMYFHDKILDTDVKKHAFYSIVLSLDKSKYDELIEIYNMQYSMIRSLKRISVERLVDIISFGKLFGRDIKTLVNPKKMQNIDYLHKKHRIFGKTQLVINVKANLFAFYKSNYHTDEDIQSAHNTIHNLKYSHLKEFEYYYLNTEARWILYYSQMVGTLDMSFQEISEKYFLEKGSITWIKKHMITELLRVIRASIAGNTRIVPLKHQTLSFEDLEDMYAQISQEDREQRIQKIFMHFQDRYGRFSQAATIDINLLKDFYIHDLNSQLKKHLYYSKILLLDNISDEDLAKLYNKTDKYVRKKHKLLHESLFLTLSGGYRYSDGDPQSSVANEIQKSFADAQERYRSLSDEEILLLARKSSTFSDYPHLAKYLTKDIYAAFVHKHMEVLSHNHYTMQWHTHLCLVLGLCDLTKMDLAIGYNVRKNQVLSIHADLMKALRYEMFAMDSSFRRLLKDSSLKIEFARRAKSNAATGRLLDVATIRKYFLHLTGEEMLAWFDTLPAFSGAREKSSLSVTALDIFFLVSVKTDMQWHVLLYEILSFDYTPIEYLARWHSLEVADIEETKNQLLRDLELISQVSLDDPDTLYDELYKAQIVEQKDVILGKDKRFLPLWQLKASFLSLRDKDIIDLMIGSEFLFKDHLDLKKKMIFLSHSERKQMVKEVQDIMKSYPHKWHVFLSHILRMDKSSGAYVAALYDYSPGSISSVKFRLRKALLERLEAL